MGLLVRKVGEEKFFFYRGKGCYVGQGKILLSDELIYFDGIWRNVF